MHAHLPHTYARTHALTVNRNPLDHYLTHALNSRVSSHLASADADAVCMCFAAPVLVPVQVYPMSG